MGRSAAFVSLNESPSEKEGKSWAHPHVAEQLGALNESPSEKEGKLIAYNAEVDAKPLNESPSEKEGKCRSTR